MRRILIDKRIKDFAADYVKEIPLVVGDVEACLRGLACKRVGAAIDDDSCSQSS